MHIDKIKQIIENNKYLLIDPSKYHKGHGNSLSIKVVIPTYCQANCDFCFIECIKYILSIRLLGFY